MNTSIPTNHNYYEECSLNEKQLKTQFGVQSSKQIGDIQKNLFSSTFEFNTKNNSLEQIQIFGFKNQRNKLEDEEQLILKLYSKESSDEGKKYIIQTGLFAGIIYHKGYQFNIVTPYGDAFLKRMLNFVNDIYIDNQDSKASKSEQTNEFQNIIAYLFIQTLEKASVLGLPKIYQQQTQRSHKVRGKIDVNAYLKREMPFLGKLTTTYREQKYIQEIIDVLFLTCKKLEQNFGKEIHCKILGTYQLLKQNYSGNYINNDIIVKAKNHTVLQNPIFEPFKKVLNYAEILLKDQSLVVKNQENKMKTYGYLFDISQLFELYLEKLLRKHFSDWQVTSQEELQVYQNMFFKRKMFPDLVMRHKETNQVIVFDAKFKKMRLLKNDLDRDDFYQIHSYIQYYQKKTLFGGLLYPLSTPFHKNHDLLNGLFGDETNHVKFIVDGVYVNEKMGMNEIIVNEIIFLTRIETLIHDSLNLIVKSVN